MCDLRKLALKNTKNKDFWEVYYERYLNNELQQITEELSLSLAFIVRVFLSLGFKSKKQIERERKQQNDVLFENLSKKYIKAEITRKEILETLKITETEFFQRMRKKGYSIKTHHYSTNVGYVARNDVEFWGNLHKQWFDCFKTLEEISEESGIDTKTMITHFAKLGFEDADRSKILALSLQKQKETNKRKYGNEFYFNTSSFKQKFSETCLDRFGVDHPWKSDVVKQQLYKTWGTDNPWKRSDVIQKISQKTVQRCFIRKNSMLHKEGFELLEDFEGLQRDDQIRRYKIKHLECGTEFEDDLICRVKCPKCHVIHGSSTKERELREFISYFCKHELVFNSKKTYTINKIKRKTLSN